MGKGKARAKSGNYGRRSVAAKAAAKKKRTAKKAARVGKRKYG